MRRTLWVPDQLARRLDGHVATLERARGEKVAWGKVVNEAIEQYLAHCAVAQIDDGSTRPALQLVQDAVVAVREAEAALVRQSQAANRIRRGQLAVTRQPPPKESNQ